MAFLVCPRCHGELSWSEDAVVCSGCDERFPVIDGIPVFAGSVVGDAEGHKLRQAAYFDSADEEYEITRPCGTPALFHWLLDEKLRRSVSQVDDVLPDANVLAMCGGSGMEAEFLARLGARVVVADISLGAARRARERAARTRLPITSIIADAEALPVADRSVDLAYVHDGLHHLEDPFRGLAELARTAKNAVSVNEPARAFVTAVAVRLGLATEDEEAGNRIARLDPDEIAALLEASGLHVLTVERYALYYRHEPGNVFRLLSRKRLVGAARCSILAFNRVAGRIGNKFTVQAVRPQR
jgi:ubiquinone/menaquinone biosynthesis C-methylase UbiE